MKWFSPLFLSAILFAGTAFAESRFDLKTRGFANIAKVMPLASVSKNPRRFNTGFKTYIAGVGRVELKFTRERVYDVPKVIIDEKGQEIPVENDVTLMRGILKVHGQESPIAGSLIKEGSRYVIKTGFSTSNGRGGAVNYYYLTAPVSGGKGHVERISRFAPALSMHGDTVLLPAKPFKKQALSAAAVTYRVLKMRVDGDKEWYDRFGKNSISKMQRYVNSAEAIYEAQLGISFDVTKFSVQSSYSLGTDNSESALEDFRLHTIHQSYFGGEEEYQLFSGRTFKESVLGVAYTGPICIDVEYAMSVTTAPTDSYGPIIFAHELGHTFGATHTSSGIMQAVIEASNLPKTFSSESKQQILNHVKNYGGCLGTEVVPSPTATATSTPTVTPTPSDGGDVNISVNLTLGKKGVFNAKFSYGEDLSACVVQLRAAAVNANLAKSKIIYKFSPSSGNDVLVGKAPFKIYPLPKNRNGFFLGEVYCPNGRYGKTGVKKINITKVNSKKKLKNKAAWLKRLFKTVKR